MVKEVDLSSSEEEPSPSTRSRSSDMAQLSTPATGKRATSPRRRMFLASVDIPGVSEKKRASSKQSDKQTSSKSSKKASSDEPIMIDDSDSDQGFKKASAKGTLKNKRSKAAPKSKQIDLRNSDEESPESSEDEDNLEDSDYDNPESPPRKRVTRSHNRAAAKKLAPSDESSDDGGKATGTRASGRQRNAVSYREAILDDDVDMLDDDDEPVKPIKKASLARPPKTVASRPAYGNIRHTRELQDDDAQEDPLRAHRAHCEKCELQASHLQLIEHRHKKRKKNKRNGRRVELHGPEQETEDEEITHGEAEFDALGGWVRCLKCPVVSHWKCLTIPSRDEILRAVREKEAGVDANGKPLPKRKKLEVFETTEFVCQFCSKGSVCLTCKDVVTEKFDPQNPPAPAVDASSVATSDDHPLKAKDENNGLLFFRCISCKRAAHYEHLPAEDDEDAMAIATEYQHDRGWTCADCASYTYPLETILAWRPYPAGAIEPPSAEGGTVDHRAPLPREYLVKWQGRSYNRLQWVPHMWLLAKYATRLKNFLTRGSLVKLPQEHASAQPSKASTPALEGPSARPSPTPSDDIGEREFGPPDASTDALARVPKLWREVDRVLDLRLWCPPNCAGAARDKQQGHRQRQHAPAKRVIEDDEDENDEEEEEVMDMSDNDLEFVQAMSDARAAGFMPQAENIKEVAAWEKAHGRPLSMDDIGLVAWGYFKWGDLTYDQSTWDTPPEASESSYPAFRRAFERYLESRTVFVKARRDPKTTAGKYSQLTSQPGIAGEDKLALRDFQVEGVNWLMHKWHSGLPGTILADEMGLGKTVQMTTLIGLLVKRYQAWPMLVVVPNSTLTNWLREFERWAPHVRVVPYFGDSESRKIIKQYELHHDNPPGKGHTTLKFHVMLATYETITSAKDGFATFKSVPYWECIVVDEAQRLKSDSSLLFKRLNELKVQHRILMTGTPLNNNIRELFNLMNFLDPVEWDDLPALEAQFQDLNEQLLAELHDKLKPYFLRRTKAGVLTLPPKKEVIVPVTMSVIQKTVYKGVIGQNAELLQALLRGKAGNSFVKSKLNNILMQLRKCIQHPYLVSPELEDKDKPPKEMHRNLIDASSKLQLLYLMLPALKQRGHRVLLFSQFKIALDIIEDFLVAEGFSFRRLDGDTKQSDRQKYMDEFNGPDSDVFIFILSTRAGGVGINLFTADTVIIFDPDYNPHQDLQAIARSHRFGQTKTVLVFKLMMKDSAEEKIMAAGKKKLALDHLIVQKMDDESGGPENVQTLLSFGAKALFDEENEVPGITYSTQSVTKLIEDTENAEVAEEANSDKHDVFNFDVAKVWEPEQGAVIEDKAAMDQTNEHEDDDFWAKHLAKATAEQEALAARASAQMGRGARRRKEVNYVLDVSPEKADKKKRRPSATSEEDDIVDDVMDVDFAAQDAEEDSDSTFEGSRGDMMDLDDALAGTTAPDSLPTVSAAEPSNAVKRRKTQAEPATGQEYCGLCHSVHGEKSCYLTNNIANLLEYRKIIMDPTHDEPYEIRARAISAIDLHLQERGLTDMLRGLAIMPPRPSQAVPRQRAAAAPTYAVTPPNPSEPMVQSGPSAVSRASSVTQPPAPEISSASTPIPVQAPVPAPTTTTPRPAPAPAAPSATVVDPSTSSDKPAEHATVQNPAGSVQPILDDGPAPAKQQKISRSSTPGMRQTTLQFGRRDSSMSASTSTPAQTGTPGCIMCNSTISHPVQQCPVLQTGSSNINNVFNRLQGSPAFTTEMQDVFRAALKFKSRASSGGGTREDKSTAGAASTPRQSSSSRVPKLKSAAREPVIEISDSD
ncbi:SNF2 family N-terminal domain-containing protein [Auriculariales sp. MPI-PUGE-AT-0066]|nr:SNF2 family N-terminal domain-containing protein [Auriculariales sp. MPI-PUGE-AT-0066]